MKSKNLSYWQVFRLIFVIFSLYLTGDAFFRWDGFKYYASFPEFLPSVALATILWTIVAVMAAVIMWMPLRILEWFCQRMVWKITANHLQVFIYTLLLIGVSVWLIKRIVWSEGTTSPLLRQVVFLGVLLISVCLTWMFRKRNERWIEFVQERITPLVWIFGICLIISVPVVAYNTLIKQTEKVTTQESPKLTVKDTTRPNIIFVIFDAMTTRDMSLYGYHLPTTPFISEWAKEATVFTNVKSEGDLTTPTVASLMTGKRLWTHQTYHTAGSWPVRSNSESLPLLLKKNGYYNMAFVGNPVASIEVLGIANSFNIAPIVTEFIGHNSFFAWKFGAIDVLLYRLFDGKIKLYDWIIQGDFVLSRIVYALSGKTYSPSHVSTEDAMNKFFSVIDHNLPEPFFAWVHFYPPHDPYIPPEPYMGMFDSSLELRTVESQFEASEGNMYYPNEYQQTIDKLRTRYDEYITYCDKQFKNFIEQLETRDRLNNTVVILSSDHGESFEHNFYRHGGRHLYEQTTHIPLIIKVPGQTDGSIVHDLLEQIDIPPTILALSHISIPAWMEGRSLLPLLRGEKLPQRHAFSMTFQKNRSRGHQITKGTIAVWEGDYKLIHYLQDSKNLLFNMKQDPDELKNLFDREPETGNRLLRLIKDNLNTANEIIHKGK